MNAKMAYSTYTKSCAFSSTIARAIVCHTSKSEGRGHGGFSTWNLQVHKALR